MNWPRFLSVVLLLACLAPPVPAQTDQDYTDKYIYADIGHETYLLEVADNWHKRMQGLSDRESLGKNMGMVFVFERLSSQSFWMKDMKFPLDFIWIKGDKVVRLDERVPPPSETAKKPVSLETSQEVEKVIELYAGEIRNSGIQVNDFVHFYEIN
jgi:uncharacterized protein